MTVGPCREAGAPSNANFYFVLRLNNAYWGLALYVEVNNNEYLAVMPSLPCISLLTACVF